MCESNKSKFLSGIQWHQLRIEIQCFGHPAWHCHQGMMYWINTVTISWDVMTSQSLIWEPCISYVHHWGLASKNNQWPMNSSGHGQPYSLFIHGKSGYGEPSGCVLSLCCLAASLCNSTLSRCYLISLSLVSRYHAYSVLNWCYW